MKHQHRLLDNRSNTRRLLTTIYLLVLTAVLCNSAYAQNPALGFAIQMGGIGSDGPRDIDLDGNGDLYVAGIFQQTADQDPGAGVANLTSAGGFDIVVASYDASGNYRWAFGVGDTGIDEPAELEIDGSGNVVITGSVTGIVDLDPGPGVANRGITGMTTAFAAKYSPTGNFIWAFTVGPNASFVGLDIDGSSNIVIVGQFSSTVDFNPAASVTNLTSASAGHDLFVARYNSGGNLIWAFRIGATSGERANAVAIDGSGNIYVTGFFGWGGATTVNFNPIGNPKKNLVSTNGAGDMFIAKYSSSGSLIWAFSAGGSGTDQGMAIAANGSSVAVTGAFSNTVDFNPGKQTNNITGGMQDIFVASYSAAGNYQFAIGITAPQCSTCQGGWGRAIDIDAGGDIYVSGNLRGTADFDPGPGTSSLTSVPTNLLNCFVARYTSTGAYVSAIAMPSTHSSNGNGHVVDGSGGIYVIGTFQETTDVDPSEGTANLTSAGGADVFLAKYNEQTQPKRSVSEVVGNQMHITPNPFISDFTLRHDGAPAPSRIQVIDMMGQVVESREIMGSSDEITLGSELPAGAYVVQIIQGEERRTMMIQKVR